mgnify:CR=1 FL=1
MADFLKEFKQRNWARDLESYKRYVNMMKSSSPQLKAMAMKQRERIRGEWPTQIKVFDAIDVEVLSK